MRIIDYRSDTVTHPTPEMRHAMAEAEVGDDVLGDDPTVKKLEEMSAHMMGKQSALFVASGTMGNLVSILAHAQRGDEIIVGDKSHIFNWEAAGASALGGISYRPVPNNHYGMINPDDVESAIRSPEIDVHHSKTTLVTLENTHNYCGGGVLSEGDIKSISDVVRRNGIKLHIDGARIFNAAVSLETPVSELVKDADSVTFCLSKGLSAPIGSVVCGSTDFIIQAHRWRKALGGGMRQVGVIAAAGIVALKKMTTRLAEDHINANKLALGLETIPGISINPNSLPTNLVFFEITRGDPEELASELSEKGIKGGSAKRTWRYATHHGITSDDIDYTIETMRSTFSQNL